MFYSFSRFSKSKFAKYLTSPEMARLALLTRIFPFKVSEYVMSELIDWKQKDEDPIYRLIFPTPGMLTPENWDLLRSAKSSEQEKEIIKKIRRQLNPHPNGQVDNIPSIGKRIFGGLQHKYKETVLFFPAQGQSCHSYCTYCFRWAQFVNLDEHKFKSKDVKDLFDYLSYQKEVTDILFTGGDPLYMSNKHLFDYLDVLIKPEIAHVTNIRLGTKALAFHPSRFLGPDGDELLAKFEDILKAGKHLTIMAHVSHPVELMTKKVKQAIRRLIHAGIAIRTQAPLIRGVNDSAAIWKQIWEDSVRLGMIPYYMFVERDTGAQHYFSVPLVEAYQIFTDAYAMVGGLSKTVRGPSMSTNPGKALIVGLTGRGQEKRFILKFIQARNPQLINKPFFAKFSSEATWFDELEIESPMKEELASDSGFFDEDTMDIDAVA